MKATLHMRLLRQTLRRLKGFATRNETIRGLLYDTRNQTAFSSLIQHEKMLADSIRVNTYRTGIAKCVKPGDVVIDLGTGTGVLAYFAVQSGARKVYAIDHSDFIETARQVAAKNGLLNVEFVQKNSRDFTPPEPADVLIHEQLAFDLFGENMIENLLDLKRRALKPNGRVLPGAFDFFVEPLVIKEGFRIPHLWEFEDLGFDLGFLRDSHLLEAHKKGDYGILSIKTHFADFLLCEPEAMIQFDVNTLDSAADIGRRFEVSRTVVRDGTLDGFCIYFRAKFDEQTVLDTSPMRPQTHWDNPVLRAERRHYKAGDRIAYTVELPALTDRMSWRVFLQ